MILRHIIAKVRCVKSPLLLWLEVKAFAKCYEVGVILEGGTGSSKFIAFFMALG